MEEYNGGVCVQTTEYVVAYQQLRLDIDFSVDQGHSLSVWTTVSSTATGQWHARR